MYALRLKDLIRKLEKMKIQIRTKDDLIKLLSEGISYAWRVNKGRLNSITEVEIYNFSGNARIVGTFDRDNTKILDNGRVAVAFSSAKIESCEFKWVGQNPIKYKTLDNNEDVELMEDEVGDDLKENEWDIVGVNEKKILLSNCEGTSGVDVGLKTSAFKPVNNYDLIIKYLNNLFFDDSLYPNDNSADYLFKYDKVDDLIILVGSTYLLRLGGDLFELSVDEYTLEELTSILSENGLNNTFLSFIQTYSDDGSFTVGDLIKYLLIAPNQTVKVQCIDSLYSDSNFVITV